MRIPFAKADGVVQSLSGWLTVLVALVGIFSWLGKQMTAFGPIGWPEAFFIGLGAGLVTLLSLAAVLFGWRYFRPLPAASPSISELPILDYTEQDRARGDIESLKAELKLMGSQLTAVASGMADRADFYVDSLRTFEQQSREQVDALRDSHDKLDHKVEAFVKLSADADQLGSDWQDLLQQQITALAADIKAARDHASGSIAALQHLHGELQKAHLDAVQDHAAFKAVVERALENTWAKLNRRCEFIDQGFRAIFDREKLLEVAADIRSLGDEMSFPTRGEPLVNAVDWDKKERSWQSLLREWSKLADKYRDGVSEAVKQKDDEDYGGDWKAADNLFPDSNAIYKYKTFRIMLRNFEQERDKVDACVRRAAFMSPSTKGRVGIDD